MESVKRYKISKDQLERVVENFVMESANIASKKAPVKNHIPNQGAEAKKHVKNKMSGKMVEKGEGVPAAGAMKKKLPQASDAKKFVSKSKATHSTNAKVVKESELNEALIIEGKKENLTADFNNKARVWYSKKFIDKPTQEDYNQFMADAEADGYEGKVGNKGRKIAYRPSSNINWSHDMARPQGK